MFTSLGEAGVSCALLKFLSSAPPLIRSVVSKISSPCMGEENQPLVNVKTSSQRKRKSRICVSSQSDFTKIKASSKKTKGHSLLGKSFPPFYA